MSKGTIIALGCGLAGAFASVHRAIQSENVDLPYAMAAGGAGFMLGSCGAMLADYVLSCLGYPADYDTPANDDHHI